jgi:hypothetical protein
MVMVDLFPDFREFLKSLNSAKVEYLVLGGYAVIYYGYIRVTNDLDVWIMTASKNAERVSRVLQEFFGFPAEAVRSELFEEKGKVFAFGRKPVRIDILTGPSGVAFRDCYKRRNMVDWDGVQVPLISLEDLKQNKLASGRPKDLADLQNLPAGPVRTKSDRKRRLPRRRRP